MQRNRSLLASVRAPLEEGVTDGRYEISQKIWLYVSRAPVLGVEY